MGWNLPPGVTVNMIPGNRPEDEWAEKLFLTFGDAIQVYCDKMPGLSPEDLVWVLREIANEAEADPEYFRYQPHPLAKYDEEPKDEEPDGD